jgi:hypothetical protein
MKRTTIKFRMVDTIFDGKRKIREEKKSHAWYSLFNLYHHG